MNRFKLSYKFLRLRKEEKLIYNKIGKIFEEYNKILPKVRHRPVVAWFYKFSGLVLGRITCYFLNPQFRNESISFIKFYFEYFLKYLCELEAKYNLKDYDLVLYPHRQGLLDYLSVNKKDQSFIEHEAIIFQRKLLSEDESFNQDLFIGLSKEKAAREWLNVPLKKENSKSLFFDYFMSMGIGILLAFVIMSPILIFAYFDAPHSPLMMIIAASPFFCLASLLFSHANIFEVH